jgi:hypothetical protein
MSKKFLIGKVNVFKDVTDASDQGCRLRFASGRNNYGERSEPKNFFAREGDNPPRNSKTNNAGIKAADRSPIATVSAPMPMTLIINNAGHTSQIQNFCYH